MLPQAECARGFSQCDSLLVGPEAQAFTYPYFDVRNPSAILEHEATTTRIGEEQMLYCAQRNISEQEAIALIVQGYCHTVISQLPMEFIFEAQQLINLTLEGSVG